VLKTERLSIFSLAGLLEFYSFCSDRAIWSRTSTAPSPAPKGWMLNDRT